MRNQERIVNSPVRMKDRFIEDMRMKKYADSTVDSYVREVERFFNRQCPGIYPAKVTETDFRNYFVHLSTERHYSGSAMKIAFSPLIA